MPHPIPRIPGGIWFFLIVAGLYLGLYLAEPESASSALKVSLKLLERIAPILGLVFVLLVLSNLLVKTDWIRTHLGEKSGVSGWILAVTGGVLSVGPIYAWYPLLGDLRHKRMRPALIAGFLYSRAIKIPLLPLLFHFFGTAFTALLVIYIILGALLNGMLLERLLRSDG